MLHRMWCAELPIFVAIADCLSPRAFLTGRLLDVALGLVGKGADSAVNALAPIAGMWGGCGSTFEADLSGCLNDLHVGNRFRSTGIRCTSLQ